MRSSGVVTVGDISWGTHLCQFYKTKEELMELIVAYVKAGLKNNELCVWVISSQPADLEKSKGVLRKSISEIDIYLEKEN